MTEPVDPQPDADADGVRRRAARDRDRRRVFGDVLDDATVDDRPGPDAARDRQGDRDGDRDGDRWLLDNVPPHHGA